VFDEIHHASDGARGNVWGNAVNAVFRDNSNVHMTLSMSGTPFRADGCPIAFLRYDNDNAVADVEYAYQQALTDEVVRPILFYGQIGDVDWINRDGERQTHSTSAQIDESAEAQRYKVATHFDSRIAKDMCLSAIAHLAELRREDYDAGMIVFAADQEQAIKWRNWFQTKVKDHVALVTSDSSDSRQQLEAYTNGRNSIIVCVDMIGEGVDIPRLRVAVYLGRVRDSRSKLWQYLGRIMRVPNDEVHKKHEAKWYMVQDPKLRAWAMTIREAVNAVAHERERQERDATGSAESRQSLRLLDAQATGEEVFQIHEQLRVTQEEWTAIERHARGIAPVLNQHWWDVAKNLLKMKGFPVDPWIPNPEETSTYKQEKQAKQRVVELAQRYGAMLTDMHHANRYGFVYEQLKAIDGHHHADCTTEQYLRRAETLKTWIAAGGRYHER
jgi:superfamily II DNA or RNA helicase